MEKATAKMKQLAVGLQEFLYLPITDKFEVIGFLAVDIKKRLVHRH
jgi:hypothetical protein